MPLLTLEQCRAHCRIDGDFDDAILGDLLAAASDAAAAYLGRELYADQAALDQALDQLPQDMAAAVTGHEAAVAAANAETNAAKAKAMREMVEYSLTEGQKIADSMGYIPLPASVADQVRKASANIQ